MGKIYAVMVSGTQVTEYYCCKTCPPLITEPANVSESEKVKGKVGQTVESSIWSDSATPDESGHSLPSVLGGVSPPYSSSKSHECISATTIINSSPSERVIAPGDVKTIMVPSDCSIYCRYTSEIGNDSPCPKVSLVVVV